MLETLSIEKARVALDFWGPFHLHASAIFVHLTAHLCHSLSAVFLQLDEGSDDIVFELADELLGRVAHWVDVGDLCNQVDLDVLVGRAFYLIFNVTFTGRHVELDLLFKVEGIASAHHNATIIFIHSVGQRALVAFGNSRLVRVLASLILVRLVLVFVANTALPFCAIFFLLLLEDVNLDARQDGLYLTRVTTDDLLDSDTGIDFLQQLGVLVHVDVSAPAVRDAVEHLLEFCQVHG